MKALTKEEKLQIIFKIVEKNNISAYEIAKNTTISEAGIGKILNKLSNKPHINSINSIYNYIINYDKDAIIQPAETYQNITEEEKKLLISTFESYLKDVEANIKSLESEVKTNAVINELREGYNLRFKLINDLEDLNK